MGGAEGVGMTAIDWYAGDRQRLRPSFELAEDSRAQLDGYLQLGRVLVARVDDTGDQVVGHLQLIPTSVVGEIEIKNMAVLPEYQGSGIGRTLIAEAVRRSSDEGLSRMLVATAAADVGALRFYQRSGFRLQRVVRDAFTASTGYPAPILIDGIPLRDQVWLDRELVLDTAQD
jgi:ribosomal protein S18 acetylase RimI-like enzyme